MDRVTCDECGSEHEIVETVRLPTRYADDIKCEVCGKVIYDYNETQQYEGKLIKRGEWPKK